MTILKKAIQIRDLTMNYCKEFNELPWHDSTLLNIEIDRKKPGENDSVRIFVKWPDGKENSIIFNDCYFFEAKMNFGIVAEESILSAVCNDEDDGLLLIRSKWSPLGVALDHLFCFAINMNSTNSAIKVFALSMSVE